MNWTKGPTVGRGSTATVSLATTVTGDHIAVKSTELSSSSFLQKEQQFLSKLSSRYIIKYMGFDVDYVDHVPMYNLLMEYAPGGSIADVIKEEGGCLDECLIRSYTRQILLGLDYLHSNNLVHCDIKCSNILVCEDGVKIGDLGCAKLADKDGNYTSSEFSGTPVFMAPEVARGEEQGFAADVWAVGCAVIEMATGCNPWPEVKNPVSALYRIGYSGDVPLFPVRLSEEAKDFLKNCLRRNDEERWTAKQLLQHPFVDLNSSFKKIENFPKNSPSGVLDQGFWDCLEESETSSAPTKFTSFSGESPVERIKQLVEASGWVNSCLPNWVEGEYWITVRSNDVDDESSNVSHENLFTDAEMEDGNSESTRSEYDSISELYVEEGVSFSVRIVIESNVVETSCASVVNSRFLDFKKINNNNNNNNCFVVDSNLNFALLALHIFGDLLVICKDTSVDESHHKRIIPMLTFYHYILYILLAF
ncbi:hypothetical protein L1987_85213 [Smallanthus sonchifolius]|uniref:Uncharacterized protein n=1 Tax=Smallanthus sonchifolius TaxID=185202 RepID=A0ACB8XWQ4_9ASTR|nr:hypothetical protein L1987_85213 [Smallanthus sonchifolius]